MAPPPNCRPVRTCACVSSSRAKPASGSGKLHATGRINGICSRAEKAMTTTNEQHLTFRIGIFVLASIVLLAILITLFGGSGTLFKAQDTYTIVFDYAPGVAEGTPVRRSGVRIGQVQKVDLDDTTGKVRVTVRIDRPHVLFQDDQPVLIQGALSGDTSIDFVQRPAESKPEPQPQGAQIQ